MVREFGRLGTRGTFSRMNVELSRLLTVLLVTTTCRGFSPFSARIWLILTAPEAARQDAWSRVRHYQLLLITILNIRNLESDYAPKSVEAAALRAVAWLLSSTSTGGLTWDGLGGDDDGVELVAVDGRAERVVDLDHVQLVHDQ